MQHLLTAEGSRLVCVEPFQEHQEHECNFDYNVGVAGCADKIVELRGRSPQVLHQQITRYALSSSGTHTLDVTEFSEPTGLVHEYAQNA